MKPNAFARARKFLNYHLTAKWLALTAAGACGLLYVALLLTLGLFTDLLCNRGEIPCYANLPYREQIYFLRQLQSGTLAVSTEKSDAALKPLGIDDAALGELLRQQNMEKLSVRNQELRKQLLWFAHLAGSLDDAIGTYAGNAVRERIRENINQLGLEVALNQNLKNFGILSLFARTRSAVHGMLLPPLARWNYWMWGNGNQVFLYGLFFLALVLGAARGGLLSLNQYAAALASTEAVVRLRRAVYHHSSRLGNLAVRALGPGEAVSVATRHMEAIFHGFIAWLTTAFREPIKLGLILIFALIVHFWLTLAVFMFALLVWLLWAQISVVFRREEEAASRQAAEQLALIQESTMMLRLVKAYLMEPFNQARIERQLAQYSDAQLSRSRGEAIHVPLLSFMGFFAVVVLLLVSGIVVINGQLGVTSGVVIATALASLYWPTMSILNTREVLRRARDSAKVLFEFLDRSGGVAQKIDAEFLPALTRLLEFENVSLTEPGGGRTLLRNVSLTIQAGQRIALIGADDLEKQALIYLVPRFFDPSAGEVRIDRKNIRWVTLDSLRTQMAMVLQNNYVFSDTVINNIGCGDRSYSVPQIVEAAKIAHAHQFIQKLPQGYETPIGDMGHPLSAGEKFRIALARAILRDPAIFIIEEPTTPLNEATRNLVDDTYTRVLAQRTVIFLPHRLATIQSCDRVYVLHNAEIKAVGEHRELVERSDLYRYLQYAEMVDFADMSPTPAAAAMNGNKQ